MKTLTWDELARACDRSSCERPHVRAALAGGATGARLPPGVRRHAGFDGVDVRRSRRRRARHGRFLRDAPRLGVQRPAGSARRDASPASGTSSIIFGFPGDRARALDDGGRRQPAAEDDGARRRGSVGSRRRRARRRLLERPPCPEDRRPRRAARVVAQATVPPRPGEVGRRGVRALPEGDDGAPAPALACDHAGDARGPPQRLRGACSSRFACSTCPRRT